MKKLILTLVVLVAFLASSTVALEDPLKITAVVTSADHELPEGYFNVGPDIYLMVRPESAAYRFLFMHRNQNITLTFAKAEKRELDRIR